MPLIVLQNVTDCKSVLSTGRMDNKYYILLVIFIFEIIGGFKTENKPKNNLFQYIFDYNTDLNTVNIYLSLFMKDIEKEGVVR